MCLPHFLSRRLSRLERSSSHGSQIWMRGSLFGSVRRYRSFRRTCRLDVHESANQIRSRALFENGNRVSQRLIKPRLSISTPTGLIKRLRLLSAIWPPGLLGLVGTNFFIGGKVTGGDTLVPFTCESTRFLISRICSACLFQWT